MHFSLYEALSSLSWRACLTARRYPGKRGRSPQPRRLSHRSGSADGSRPAGTVPPAFVASTDAQRGVPTFLWAVHSSQPSNDVANLSVEAAARLHLARHAPRYGLSSRGAGDGCGHPNPRPRARRRDRGAAPAAGGDRGLSRRRQGADGSEPLAGGHRRQPPRGRGARARCGAVPARSACGARSGPRGPLRARARARRCSLRRAAARGARLVPAPRPARAGLPRRDPRGIGRVRVRDRGRRRAPPLPGEPEARRGVHVPALGRRHRRRAAAEQPPRAVHALSGERAEWQLSVLRPVDAGLHRRVRRQIRIPGCRRPPP